MRVRPFRKTSKIYFYLYEKPCMHTVQHEENTGGCNAYNWLYLKDIYTSICPCWLIVQALSKPFLDNSMIC